MATNSACTVARLQVLDAVCPFCKDSAPQHGPTRWRTVALNTSAARMHKAVCERTGCMRSSAGFLCTRPRVAFSARLPIHGSLFARISSVRPSSGNVRKSVPLAVRSQASLNQTCGRCAARFESMLPLGHAGAAGSCSVLELRRQQPLTPWRSASCQCSLLAQPSTLLSVVGGRAPPPFLLALCAGCPHVLALGDPGDTESPSTGMLNRVCRSARMCSVLAQSVCSPPARGISRVAVLCPRHLSYLTATLLETALPPMAHGRRVGGRRSHGWWSSQKRRPSNWGPLFRRVWMAGFNSVPPEWRVFRGYRAPATG